MQATQVYPPQDQFYHGAPQPQPTAPYSNGVDQPYRQDQQQVRTGNNHHSSPNMYPYHNSQQPPPPQQQHPQQHPQGYPQQPQHHQQQSPAGYPGMQAQQASRMPPPGQSGMLPPMHSGMPAPLLPSLPGGQPMQPGMSQQPMYGVMPQGMPQQRQPEPKQMSFSGIKGDYKYTLRVEQQPQRARMCGFGDKDRRPITPPPCVRLIITHKDTGQEVDHSEIDGNFFVLQVDLWNQDASQEVNIVRSSSSSPAVSISTATTTSYPPPQERTLMNQFGQPVPIFYGPDGQGFYDPNQTQGYAPNFYNPSYSAPVVQQPNSSYTRNLIGSLTVNASLLEDTEKKLGWWFVLQDLSVRMEGWFRLKMNFIDVGDPSGATGLNRAKCPVLAWSYSEPFQVYSAKKFPGVIESTPLSKAFAGQGIKIPIRKEGRPEKGEDDDD